MIDNREPRPFSSLFTTTDKRPDNPTLIAARKLAKRGLGITIQSTPGYNGAPHPLTVAIFCATPDDKQILRDVAFSASLDSIREARIERFGSRKPLFSVSEIEVAVEEAIKDFVSSDEKLIE